MLKHNKRGPCTWFAGMLAAAGLLMAIPLAQPVYAAPDDGSNDTPAVQTNYAGFSAVSDVKVNDVSVKRYGHYSITFSPGAKKDVTGTMENQTDILFDKKVDLTNKYKRTGYTFIDWKGSDGNNYEAQTEANADTFKASDGSTLNLTAIWEAHHYTVRFKAGIDGADKESQMADQTMTYDSSAILNNNTFTKEGYQLTGWKGSDGKTYSNMSIVRNLTADQDGVFTMTGIWTPANDCAAINVQDIRHTHNYVNGFNDTYHFRHCSVCGQIEDAPDGTYTPEAAAKDASWASRHKHHMADYWDDAVNGAKNCDIYNMHHHYCTDNCGYSYADAEDRAEHTLNGYTTNDEIHIPRCTVCNRSSWSFEKEYRDKVNSILGDEAFNNLSVHDLYKLGISAFYVPASYPHHEELQKLFLSYARHRDANGYIGDAGGHAGTCEVCGRQVNPQHNYSLSLYFGAFGSPDGTLYAGSTPKLYVESCQGGCGKINNDNSIVVPGSVSGNISYTDTEIDVKVRLQMDKTKVNRITKGSLWHSGIVADVKTYNVDISDDGWVDVTMAIERDPSIMMYSQYHILSIFGPEEYVTGFIYIPMDIEAPALTNFSHKEADSASGFASSSTLTFSGTEDWGKSVTLDVTDETGRKIIDNVNLAVNDKKWSYSVTPEDLEAAKGSKFTVTVTDPYGNKNTYTEKLSNIDSIAPVLKNPLDARSWKSDSDWTSDPEKTGGWHKSVDWTAVVTEAGAGGTKIGINNRSDLAKTSEVKADKDGVTYRRSYHFIGDKYDDDPYRFYTEDAVGNINGYDIYVGKLDNTAPHIGKVTANGLNVTVSSYDDVNADLKAKYESGAYKGSYEGSGVKRFGYLNVAKDSKITWIGSSASFTVPEAGTYLIFAEDNVGNISEGYTEKVGVTTNAKQNASSWTMFDVNE